MLTGILMRNFKLFDEVRIGLGRRVLLFGPNNSGKSTVLQALALWQAGLGKWNEKWGDRKSRAEKKTGVTLNRRDISALSVPNANMLWRGMQVRQARESGAGKKLDNIRLEIVVTGITQGREWQCGLEFDHANEDSVYCRPLREDGDDGGGNVRWMPVPPEASLYRVAYLPPLSGLEASEPLRKTDEINLLLAEGQTARVLRNLCLEIHQREDPAPWNAIVSEMQHLFGVTLLPPQYNAERGEIVMAVKEKGQELDLAAMGRGMQQILLLLAHLHGHTQSVLLLDGPDTHLEPTRQRQLYAWLASAAEAADSQVIMASHSGVLLNEAIEEDVVFVFSGKPRRKEGGRGPLSRAFREAGADQYFQAEQAGWVLYVKGGVELGMLQAWASVLGHPARDCLGWAFVRYCGDRPQYARDHFHVLRGAKPDLMGCAILDGPAAASHGPLRETAWRKRSMENYVCHPDLLLRYALHDVPDDLFSAAEREKRASAMGEAVEAVTAALGIIRGFGAADPRLDAGDDFLRPVFRRYHGRIGVPDPAGAVDLRRLAGLMQPGEIDPEVVEKLDLIWETCRQARAGGGTG